MRRTIQSGRTTMQAAGVLEQPRTEIEWADDVSLERFNSMRIPSVARRMATVRDEKTLRQFLRWANESGEPFIVLGGGTNVILADDHYEQTLLRLAGDFDQFSIRGEFLTAGAATPLAHLVQESCKAGLSGLESAWGIPGTLGGAIAGNAGTPDWAMADSVLWVEVYDRSGGKRQLGAAQIQFGYRRSSLAGCIITRARLALHSERREAISQNLAAVRSRRRNQPRAVRSAGCIFKNPPGDSAGRLIDEAGLKGFRCRGAIVSSEHANFIVNDGQATGRDVTDLIDAIQRRVLETFDIRLDVEVQILRSLKPVGQVGNLPERNQR